MKKRMLIVVGAMVLMIAALGSLKFFQIREAIAQGSSFQPPPEAVTTRKPSSLRAIETSFVIRGSSSATRTSGWVPTPHLFLQGTDHDRLMRAAGERVSP